MYFWIEFRVYISPAGAHTVEPHYNEPWCTIGYGCITYICYLVLMYTLIYKTNFAV